MAEACRVTSSCDSTVAAWQRPNDPLSRYLSDSLQSYLEADSVSIANFGFDSGEKSLGVVRPQLESFKAQSNAKVLVYHCIQPGSEWRSTFTSFERNANRNPRMEDVYSFAVGKSFYSQCLPRNYIDVSYACSTFQWLSRPSEGRNQLYPYIHRSKGVETNLPQRIREDLETNCAHRYAELRPGGHLIFDLPHFRPSSRNLLTPLIEVAYRMRDWGLVSESFLESFRLPIGLGTLERNLTVLRDLPVHFDIVSYQEVEQEIPFYKEYRETGDAEQFARKTTTFYRDLFGPHLKSSCRSGSAGESLIIQFFDLVGDSLRERPEPIVQTTGYFHLQKPTQKV